MTTEKDKSVIAEKNGTEKEERPEIELDYDTSARDPNLPTPPDGGWGWAVVFGCFMIHVIADGCSYSFGVMLPSLVVYFDAGRGELGGLGAVMIGITWGCGPIASAVTNKFGCRKAAIGGALLAWFGFFISIWAPSILYLYFSIGLIGGLGLGIMYLPSIVAVSFYFEKKRAFATGLAVCGSGIGTFLIAPLSQLLLDEFGWKGCILIQSGMLLNCVLCGALFRPLEMPKNKSIPLAEQGENGEKLFNGSPRMNVNEDVKAELKGASSIQSLPTTQRQHSVDPTDAKLHQSDLRLDRILAGKPKPISPMARKDIFYSASLQNIPMYKSNHSLYAQSIASIPTELEEEEKCGSRCCPCSKSTWSSFKEMTDISLFKDPVFMLFSFSNLLTSIGFCVPYIYLPDRAHLLGIDEKRGSFLVSGMGIGNTLGRVIFGYISDRPCVNRLMMYNTVLTICGIISMISVACVTFGTLTAYAIAFGFLLGVYVGITPVVLVDLLGLEKLTNAFGIVLLWQGIGAVVGPPLLGYVYDVTLSYDNTFYLMGAIVSVSGLMLYAIPCIQAVQKKKLGGPTKREMDMGKIPVEGDSSTNQRHVTTSESKSDDV